MVRRAQWARIEPLLPDRTPRRGGGWRDRRQVIDAIAFKYRTGTPWTDLPERRGSWKGARSRLRMWALDGTWERVFAALLAEADAEYLDRVVSVDSTIVRAHQHAAGVRHNGPRPASRPSCPRTVPRRTDDEDPPRGRRPVPPARMSPTSRDNTPGPRGPQLVPKNSEKAAPDYSDTACDLRKHKSGRQDLNLRPLDPQSSALPSCATSRYPSDLGFPPGRTRMRTIPHSEPWSRTAYRA